VFQHLFCDVASNGADGLIARLRFGKLGYRMVPKVGEPQSSKRALNTSNVGPTFLTTWLLAGRVLSI
jgi:hypothetical protein